MINGIKVITLCGSTLCGSTTFKDAYNEVWKELQLNGNIVLGSLLFRQSGDSHSTTPEVVEMLNRVHRTKIEMADEIYVIDVGGYIGESTKNEIAYAQSLGKPIIYASKCFAQTSERAEIQMNRVIAAINTYDHERGSLDPADSEFLGFRALYGDHFALVKLLELAESNDDREVSLGILHILGNLHESLTTTNVSQIISILKACRDDEDAEITEYLVDILEEFECSESLDLLRDLSIATLWLRDYRDQVIEEMTKGVELKESLERLQATAQEEE